MKIFMVGEAANHKDKLAAALPIEHTIVALPREAAYAADFDREIGADDAIVSLRFSRKEASAPAFRLLHVPGAGLDGIDFDSVPASAFVCNVFEHETAIAEFVLFAMLRTEIRLDDMRAAFSPATWPEAYRNRVPHGELRGRTVGIVGFGRIGRAIARLARAFRMRVVALDAAGEADGLADEMLRPAELPRLLGEADYLVVACPLTPQTQGMIGAAELGMLPRTAVVVSVSRAEVIDEEALYEALRDGVVAGAYLDVWYRYPKGADDRVEPSRFPFHALPNAVCTPHSCAWTTGLPGRRYAVIAENLARLARGEPLLNVVRAPPTGRAP
jgi:phosphoglycerate dehydrogenase-like enzyme